MAGRFCTFSSVFTLFLIEIAVMLSFWVGDYWTPFFSGYQKPCDVTNSSIVRKLIQKNWHPILNRYGVSLPIECPLNLSRDVFAVRQPLKRARSSHWQCLKCGKKFYLERHLDLHIERRHSSIISKAEDSVCLGEYCDVMRCDVLMSSSFLDQDSKSTDISIWTPNTAASKHHQQQQQPPTKKTSPSSPTLFLPHEKYKPPESQSSKENTQANSNNNNNDNSNNNNNNNKDSANPNSQPPPVQCDEEHFALLRQKCADLVWECLQGLISVLDAKSFKALQTELESTSCSYLSCTRYGDTCCSGQSRIRGKLRPFFIVFGSLLISLCLALAYYFVWVYTQSSVDAQQQIYYQDLTNLSETNYTEIPTYLHPTSQPLINRTTHL